MFIVTIGYNDYAVPDEQAQHLFNIIGTLKPIEIKNKYNSSNKTYHYSNEELSISCVKIADDKILNPEEETIEEIEEAPKSALDDSEIPF